MMTMMTSDMKEKEEANILDMAELYDLAPLKLLTVVAAISILSEENDRPLRPRISLFYKLVMYLYGWMFHITKCSLMFFKD